MDTSHLAQTARRTGLHLWVSLPTVMRDLLRHGYEAARLWVAEEGSNLGASIAFYSMFALAPLLVVAIAIAGAVFGAEAARGQIVDQISGLVGKEAAESIQTMIASAWRSDRSGLAAAVGVVTLLIGASGVFAGLRQALNRIGRVPAAQAALSAFVRARLIAFALVLGFGFLMIVSLLLSAVLTAFTDCLSARMPVLAGALTLLDWAVSALVLSAAFTAFLRWLPDRPPRWRSAMVGAVVSALLFVLGKQLIALYLGRSSTANSFGAAGSFAVVMLWIYYTAQILLFGAAMAWSIDGVRAETPHPPDAASPPPAQKVAAKAAAGADRSVA